MGVCLRVYMAKRGCQILWNWGCSRRVVLGAENQTWLFCKTRWCFYPVWKKEDFLNNTEGKAE